MAYDSKLVSTPVEESIGNPSDHKGGEGTYNGEPGVWPGRTTGGTQLPEKTLDGCGNFSNAGKGKG